MLNKIKGLFKQRDSFFIRRFYSFSRFIYHRVKKTGNSIALLSYVLDLINEVKTKRKEDFALASIAKRGYKIIEIENVYEKFRHRKNDICHIIGGGWSFNLSYSKIHHNDFVIGMNYSALADLKFDVYFVEQGLCDANETKLRTTFIDEVVSKQAATIYYKNAFGYNDIDYVIKNYADRARFIKSYPIYCSNKVNALKTMKSLLVYDPVYMKQFISTSISSVVFARNIGFKEIVLHGLDFGGAYFYEQTELDVTKRRFLPPRNSLSRGKDKHQTVLSTCGVITILPVIADLLNDEKVNLYSATSKSPSSKYLNVYRVN